MELESGTEFVLHITVAGTVVRLEAASERELADLHAALADGQPATNPPELVLRSQRGSVPVPVSRRDRVVQHVAYWEQEGGDQIVATGPGQAALVSHGHALLDPGDGGVRGIHALLLPVLGLLFKQRGACLVHGAAILSGDGRQDPKPGAWLVLGASGQGKSTLVTAALSLGRIVLSDDLLVLRLSDDGVSVSGVPQPLALPADQVGQAVVGAAIPGDPRDRREPASPPQLSAEQHPVTTVLLVAHSGEPGGHLLPAEGRAVFSGLLNSTLEGISPATVHHTFPFAARVAAAAGWHFGHAADAARRIPAAAAHLEQLRVGRDRAF